MEPIKSLNSSHHGNSNNSYQVENDQQLEDQKKETYHLAEILKSGYKKRNFSNTSTINWLQTWRVSNL